MPAPAGGSKVLLQDRPRLTRTCHRQPHLEVVTEGPRAQHLEESVMVDILPHIVQVIVLPPSSDTLLRVGCSVQFGHGMRRVDGVQEDRLELQKRGC